MGDCPPERVNRCLMFRKCLSYTSSVRGAQDCRNTDHHVTEPDSSRAATNSSNHRAGSAEPGYFSSDVAGSWGASTRSRHFFDLASPQDHSQWRPPHLAQSPRGLLSVRHSQPLLATKYSIPSLTVNLNFPL